MSKGKEKAFEIIQNKKKGEKEMILIGIAAAVAGAGIVIGVATALGA